MRRIKNLKRTILCALAMVVAMSGTVALAATNHPYGPFNINIENEAYTPLAVKETSTSAYVDQDLSRNSVLICRVFNSGSAAKSSTVTLYGVDNGRMSYSGYNVDEGDYLRMKIKNSSSSGGIVTVSGKWRP